MTSSSLNETDARTASVEELISAVKGFVETYYGKDESWRYKVEKVLSTIKDLKDLVKMLPQMKDADITDIIMDFDNTLIPDFSHGNYSSIPADKFHLYPETSALLKKAKELGLDVYIASFGKKPRIESILRENEVKGIAAYYCSPVASHVEQGWFRDTPFSKYSDIVARAHYGKLPHLMQIFAPFSRVGRRCGRIFVFVDDNRENCAMAKAAGIPTFEKDPCSTALRYLMMTTQLSPVPTPQNGASIEGGLS